eukprot:maker-scaffold237_size242172-snap-gene-1.33 protein:Tk05181 transcript:maker-scaffold237_size242172-snap-gene-1.33-mRNA-1 annotation:"paramyosin "
MGDPLNGIATVGSDETAQARNHFLIDKVDKLRQNLAHVSAPSSDWPASSKPFSFSFASADTLDLTEIRDRAPPGKEYRRLRNHVSSMVKRNKLRTNLDKLRKSHNDPKVLWGLANAALGKPNDSEIFLLGSIHMNLHLALHTLTWGDPFQSLLDDQPCEPRRRLSLSSEAAAVNPCRTQNFLATGLRPRGFHRSLDQALDKVEHLVNQIKPVRRLKRSSDDDRGVTNLDIRDAILQLLNVIRDGGKKAEKSANAQQETITEILSKVESVGSSSGGSNTGVDQKIDNISTFLLRMNSKLDSIERRMKRGLSGSGDVVETLAKESYSILNLLSTDVANTRNKVDQLAKDSKDQLDGVEALLVDTDEEKNETRSLAKVLKDTEFNILGASNTLKDIVIESGHMAESLFERVNDGYKELTDEIKGLANVEQVLLDTADSVMDTKRKVEFGVQQIIFKVGELVKMSGGAIDEQMKDQFADVTKAILTNQNEALGNLTQKVEKEIGQVWRQMGIMYRQVTNSISILEKVKNATEGYVVEGGSNLGTMEGQVEGLTDRMVDVDSNLNYMLGQLSLVVQEFNQTELLKIVTGRETFPLEAMEPVVEEGDGEELEHIESGAASEYGGNISQVGKLHAEAELPELVPVFHEELLEALFEPAIGQLQY